MDYFVGVVHLGDAQTRLWLFRETLGRQFQHNRSLPTSIPILSAAPMAALASGRWTDVGAEPLARLGVGFSGSSPSEAAVAVPVRVGEGLWGFIVFGMPAHGRCLGEEGGVLEALEELAGDLSTALKRWAAVQAAGPSDSANYGVVGLLEGLETMVRIDARPSGGQCSLRGDAMLRRIFGPEILDAPDRLAWLADRIHPSDRPHVERFWKWGGSTCAYPPETDTIHYRVQTLSGVTRHISETVHIVRNAEGRISRLYGRMEDDTSRQRSRSHQRRFADIVERDTRPTWIIRPDGTLIYFNKSAARRFGIDEKHRANGLRLADFLGAGAGVGALAEILGKAAKDGAWQGEAPLAHLQTQAPLPSVVRIFTLEDDGASDSSSTPIGPYLAVQVVDLPGDRREQDVWHRRMESLKALLAAAPLHLSDQPGPALETLLKVAARHFEAALALYAKAQGPALAPVSVVASDPALRQEAILRCNLLDHPMVRNIWESDGFLELAHPPQSAGDSPLSGATSWAAGVVVGLGSRRHGLLLLSGAKPRPEPMAESDAILLQLFARCVGSGLERHEYRRLMIDALDEAEAANGAKSQFLTALSQEVRKPLAAIFGQAELLTAETLAEDQAAAIESLLQSGRDLVAVLEEVEEFTHVESGQATLELGAVDLRLVVEDLLEELADVAAARGVELVATVEPSVPSPLELDEGRMRQLFGALLRQALGRSRGGLVHLSVSIAPAGVDVEGGALAAGSLTLLAAVRDGEVSLHGDKRGKNPDLADAGSKSDGMQPLRDLTLRLPLCRKLCSLMGGELETQTGDGSGATVTFFVPSRNLSPAAAGGNWFTTPPPDAASPVAGHIAAVVASQREIRDSLTAQMLFWRMKVLAVDDLRDLGEGGGLPEVVVACEEDLRDGGAGRLRERLGSVPVVLLRRAVQRGRGDGPTRVEAPALPSEVRVLELRRPARAMDLLDSLRSALETGLQDSVFPAQDAQHIHGASAARNPLRILVVEDNPTNMKVALLLLANLGYDADQAADGREAVERVRHASLDPEKAYDLILMDIHMPVLDGLAATGEIRRLTPAALDHQQNLAWRGQPYIAAVTADALPGDREKCLAAGMDDYLPKPVTLHGLRRLVRRAYRARQPASADTVG